VSTASLRYRCGTIDSDQAGAQAVSTASLRRFDHVLGGVWVESSPRLR
jgi:hypothetical protein